MTRKTPRGSVPRFTTHRGVVFAHGFWVPAVAGHDPERQVLGLWQSGADVRRLADGYVLLLREPRRVSAEHGLAAPLVRQNQRLVSAPLTKRELEQLDTSANLLLVIHGELRLLQLEQLERVDPATWLDLSRFSLAKSRALGAPPEPIAALSRPADAQAMFDERIGRTAEDHAKRRELLEALTELERQRTTGARPSRLRGALRLLARVVRGLIPFLPKLRRPAKIPQLPPATSTPRSSLWHRLGKALATWIASTRVMAYLGRKQAEYLQELFELLAAHDDQEILRRAIPLAHGKNEPGQPALLPPTPRTSLGISLTRRGPGSAMTLVEGLYERLRRSYEAVFARLDAAGRHEEAAYFLAEILGESERAVAYLERHGELELAAKLAEARELPAGLLVRQWFVAGNRDRALMIAVREGAFDDAILRLEKAGQTREAAALRLLQAERLAKAGRFVRAAELAHRLEQGVPLALRWLELARAAGDVRGVPLELSLDASRFDLAHAALQPLFGAAPPEQLPTLVHVVEELARLDVQLGKPLARELTREILALAATDGSAALAQTARQAAAWIGGAFKADQPPVVSFERRVNAALRRYELSASDTGSRAALDLHRFGSQLVVALGEAGVVMLSRTGQRIAHFDVPAEALVASSDGSRLLCVATRGKWLQVGRIDLAARRSQAWCELEAASFSRTFDGETWLVCRSGWAPEGESELLQLDVLDDQPRVLRRLPMPLDAPTVHVGSRHCNLVGSEPFGSLEHMRYDLPQLTLRKRSVVVDFSGPRPADPAGTEVQRFFAGAAAAQTDKPPVIYQRWIENGVDKGAPRLLVGERSINLPTGDLSGWATLSVEGPCYALQLTSEARTRIFVGSINASDPCVDLQLHGAAGAALRWHGELLLIADRAGRLLGFDATTGSPRLDLRV